MGIKAIAIDYYGTLVDIKYSFRQIKGWINEKHKRFTENYDKIYFSFFKEHARMLHSGEFILGQQLLMNSYVKACNKYSTECYHEEFRSFVYNLFAYPKALPGAMDVVENLRRKYPVLLLTNADNIILYESLKMNKFKFDYVISSEDIRCNKPDRRMFLAACSQLSQPPEFVLMIGDSLAEDIWGAANCGMRAIWVNTMNSSQVLPFLQISEIGELCSKMMRIGG